MRSDIRRLVLGVFGALAIVFAIVMAVDRGFDVTDGATGAPLLWLIPVVSITAIAGVAWILLAQIPLGSGRSSDYRSIACTSCAKTVLTDWRLCPYCGAALSPEPPAQHSPTAG